MQNPEQLCRKALVLIVCSLVANHCPLTAQTVLLEQTVPDTGSATNFGQNRRHYMGVLLGFGMVLPNGDNDFPVRFGSGYSQASLFYKLKITGLLAIVGEVGYRREQLNIQQTDEKRFPATEKWDRERLIVHALPLALNLRLNVDPQRGNTVGHFLDLGCMYLPTVGSANRYRYTPNADTPNAPPPPDAVVTTNRGLGYIQATDYAVQVRLGFTRVMLVAQYRLGDVIDPGYFTTSTTSTATPRYTAEWPRLSFGVQFGLY
jgi:hypothetical protein